MAIFDPTRRLKSENRRKLLAELRMIVPPTEIDSVIEQLNRHLTASASPEETVVMRIADIKSSIT